MTYSLAALTSARPTGNSVAADNSQLQKSLAPSDANYNGVGAEQSSMMLNTPFLVQGPDLSQAWYTYDAERSIPGVLRILKKV